jgi:TRAP-type C4-dicarboxylate transport system permease small subunit
MRWRSCDGRLIRVNSHILRRVACIVVLVVVVAPRIGIGCRSLLSSNFVRGEEAATGAPRATHSVLVT